MKEYMYPDNLKGKPILWLWYLRDIGIICIGSILSVLFITNADFYLPFVLVAVYGFLSIRFDETSIFDFIIYACNFLFFKQQFYTWERSCGKEETK